MNYHKFIDIFYTISPLVYNWQLNFFNGNHFEILKKKLNELPCDSILEIGCGTAPILKTFNPRFYYGFDVEQKFLNIAEKQYKNKNYKFNLINKNNINIKKPVDIILFSHTTHHLTDKEIRKLLLDMKGFKFKYIVIYDGRPHGIFKNILTKLDYEAAKFRNVEDFLPIINNIYKIKHMETFRSNRPFYEYQLLILSKK